MSLHTGERFQGSYKEEGVYNKENCEKIDFLLRDHRTNEVYPIDHKLLDFAYAIACKINPKKPENVKLEVVSGYRSCKTNTMLRQKCSKVSKNSYHMKGKALDFRVKGIAVTKLGSIARSLQLGGVGTYVKPAFVHIDKGRVRQWGG